MAETVILEGLEGNGLSMICTNAWEQKLISEVTWYLGEGICI